MLSIPSPLSTILMLLMTWHRVVLGCFPTDDVFQRSTIWSQDLRNPWRRLFTIGLESNDVMRVENQTPDVITYARVICLQKFSGHRYLVKVVTKEKGIQYQCLRFTPLTHQVVRRALTKLLKRQDEVNCETDIYKEDEELMIAYRHMTTEVSPLKGGYQLILQKGANVRRECLTTLNTYNPRLEIGCSGEHILVDFGSDCSPIIPVQDQSPYRLPFAYLNCIGSWDEEGGEVKAILLQERFSFWCLHYKPVKGGTDGELLDIHLSFRGRCSSDVFNSNKTELPDEFSAFGILAKYVPSCDERCTKTNFNQKCMNVNESKCFETNECPSNCQRCNQMVKKKECGFTNAVGHWIGGDSEQPWEDDHQQLIVDVNRQDLEIAGHGKFSCADSYRGVQDFDVYQVVRNDPSSSCMPFYACVKLSIPVPGVMNFFLEAADRDRLTGLPMRCTRNAWGSQIIIPADSVAMTTLINKDKLQTVACNIPKDMLFSSTLRTCKFSLRQCSGSCSTLHGDYDPVSCGNDSKIGIEHDHVCHASIQLKQGVQGIITSSVSSKRYHCWMFTDHKLFVASPEFCNSDWADYIVEDSRSMSRYDPFFALRPLSMAAGITALHHVIYLAFVLSSLIIHFS